MAGCKVTSISALFFLLINLMFFTMVSSSHVPCPPPPSKPEHGGHGHTHPQAKCPRDALKLAACADLLGGLVHVVIGTPPKTPCCSLIEGLVDLEAAACLCTAIKAKVLGINIDASVSLSLLLNYCGHKVPSGFQCA